MRGLLEAVQDDATFLSCARLPQRVHHAGCSSPTLSAVWGGSGPARGGQPRRACSAGPTARSRQTVA